MNSEVDLCSGRVEIYILNFLGKEDLGEGRAQEGLSGCWRVKRAVVLLHFQLVQPRLGAGARESQC